MNIESLVLIAGCLLLGWGVARVANPPPALSQHLNWWVINIALPALVMELIPNVELDMHLAYLLAAFTIATMALGAGLVISLITVPLLAHFLP